MKQEVIGIVRADHEVFVAVVEPVTIDVVDLYGPLDGLAKRLFGNQDVSKSVFPVLVTKRPIPAYYRSLTPCPHGGLVWVAMLAQSPMMFFA
jgi:hypothetical protein